MGTDSNRYLQPHELHVAAPEADSRDHRSARRDGGSSRRSTTAQPACHTDRLRASSDVSPPRSALVASAALCGALISAIAIAGTFEPVVAAVEVVVARPHPAAIAVRGLGHAGPLHLAGATPGPSVAVVGVDVPPAAEPAPVPRRRRWRTWSALPSVDPMNLVRHADSMYRITATSPVSLCAWRDEAATVVDPARAIGSCSRPGCQWSWLRWSEMTRTGQTCP